MDVSGLKYRILTVLNVIMIFIIGMMGLVFVSLYVDILDFGGFAEYKIAVQVCIFAICTILTLLTMIFYLMGYQFIYKLSYIFIIVLFFSSIVLYLLKNNGILDKIKSVEDLRNYISGFKNWAVVVFIILQFLQVVVLPIPGILTVGAGVLLFGPLLGALYSLIGILIGSFAGFFIGRFLGYRVASWLVGEKNLKSAMEKVKGKDKVVLTFMFLFPFFPDDVLCFVAGLSTMSNAYFAVMITVTRIISVITSSYSLNGSIIPYNTWWGILIWIAIFALVIYITYYIYNYGDIIEKYILKKFHKKKKKSK